MRSVGDGIWGAAIWVRVRWDRLTRRVVWNSTVRDPVLLSACQSGITTAAAFVGVLAVLMGAQVMSPLQRHSSTRNSARQAFDMTGP